MMFLYLWLATIFGLFLYGIWEAWKDYKIEKRMDEIRERNKKNKEE